MKPFPIPVVPFGPGSQVEDETLEYVSMPQGMSTYRPPVLPEADEVAQRTGAQRALHAALVSLEAVCRGEPAERVSLRGLGEADLALVNQVMGEGEVSAKVEGPGASLYVQESVFAGVWRVMRFEHAALVDDWLEAGTVPAALRQAAADDVQRSTLPPLPEPWPEGVMNAPMLLTEIEDQWQRWQPGQPPHVVNLTLLPMSPLDIGFLDHQLGTGHVLILSRGYGNCRISNTLAPNCWRVVYYNSQDAVILNTVEVVDLPEVACAAPEDLRDSRERLHEVLQWVEGAAHGEPAA
jgi:hydrogenase-1 operon protein HyaF